MLAKDLLDSIPNAVDVTDDHALPSGATVRIRALAHREYSDLTRHCTRPEAKGGWDSDTFHAGIIHMGLVDPALTLAEAAELATSKSLGIVEGLTGAILALSRFGKPEPEDDAAEG
jgi:hypothetical protein